MVIDFQHHYNPDYPQDFTGVNTDTGKGIKELKNYIETIRNLTHYSCARRKHHTLQIEE
jgi:hypothetical protein